MLSRVIAKNVGDVFLRHTVVSINGDHFAHDHYPVSSPLPGMQASLVKNHCPELSCHSDKMGSQLLYLLVNLLLLCRDERHGYWPECRQKRAIGHLGDQLQSTGVWTKASPTSPCLLSSQPTDRTPHHIRSRRCLLGHAATLTGTGLIGLKRDKNDWGQTMNWCRTSGKWWR